MGIQSIIVGKLLIMYMYDVLAMCGCRANCIEMKVQLPSDAAEKWKMWSERLQERIVTSAAIYTFWGEL